MSPDFVVLVVLILIVAAVFYFKKHPEAKDDLQARLQGIENRLHQTALSVPPSTQPSPAPAPVVVVQPPAPPSPPAPPAQVSPTPAPPAVATPGAPPASVSIVFDPAKGIDAYRQLVASLAGPFGFLPLGLQIVSPNGNPIDVRGQEILPGGGATADYSGNQLWKMPSLPWRATLAAGQIDSRNFEVPAGWRGSAEYAGDHAAMQGFMEVFLDGRQLNGAGESLGSIAPGVHTLTARGKENPQAVGVPVSASLNIFHNP